MNSQTQSNHFFLCIFILMWGTFITYLILSGVMYDEIGTPPFSILFANIIPAIIFAVLYTFSTSFRTYVLSFNPSLLAGLHASRTIGFSFLAFASIGQLPWLFAIPAGIGDMTAAILAPFIAFNLFKNKDFIKSKAFISWNIFGLIDFLAAIGSGGLSRVLGPDVTGASMEAMGTLPLMIIPAFLVPIMMLTHMIMIIQCLKARKKAS